ncbi:MAG: DUF4476 domain-containing protein [Bacteroidetes bacterium]|nr:DUF4476 domain-containing protein [Bacteroidota bacterium]HET6243885.1 DUF4476 domain-containing protein [Bacteroidia bacterium]
MKQLIYFFLLFSAFRANAQQEPELPISPRRNNRIHENNIVEKYAWYKIFNQHPIQIGSAYLFSQLTPLEVFIPIQNIIPSAFDLLLFTVYNSPFDDRRIKISTHYIQENGVFSFQLLEILALLSFDTNRFELAKFAYPYVIDKEHYFLVLNAFELERYKSELIEFIYRY